MPMRILVLGKVRSIRMSDAGPVVRLAHLPNELAIAVSSVALAKLRNTMPFAWLDGHALHPEFQLFVLMTIQRGHDAVWQAQDFTGLITGEEFIPLFSIEEALLCKRLVQEERAFYKPLPYDGPAARLPNLILTDCGNHGVPLEIMPTEAREAAMRRLRIDTYEASQRRFWIWDTRQTALPAAPSPAS
jgi:hypothetical protein